ncbi:MAG: aminopeptidase P family protein [Lachnospiraceae bacterium]|nr:aminopeptidase P family protein [Lachnospiraceae bacterium]
MIQKRLSALRNAMEKAGIDCYIIPTSDFHNSEYVSEYFMVRKYFSGFTGSAGTLVVFQNKAALFTDGRYFIQAAKELQGSAITLMKMGEPDVPTLTDYVKQELADGQTIGFDGRVMSAGDGLVFEKIAEEKHGIIIWNLDLAEEVWTDRPALPATKAYVLGEEYSGEAVASKLRRVREKMTEEGADIHILTTLDDIAWLLNLRADDVESCPVLLSYFVITKETATLFGREAAFGEEVKEYLTRNNISLKSYECFYEDIAESADVMTKKTVWVCENRIDYRLKKELGGLVILNKANPTSLMKAIKNETEQENIRKAHLMDAVAVTKFMYWLKQNVGKMPMTEISAAEYLEKLRAENETFIEPSFSTICAYGENGAIIHYSASPEQFAEIRPEGMLMVDSGGHYFEGSTDITRTFVLGEISEEMKSHFTLAARAMLRLKNAKFLYGAKGINLDVLAREVFWEKGLDYKHGTGHGVGYLLSVHEGPNSFRFKPLAGSDDDWCFEEGMVTTDEPGIYIEGSHGVRIENELLCRKGEKNEYGQFMYFEDLTYVPIDLDGIDVKQMNEREIDILNTYHKEVCGKLSPYFESEALEWLRHATRQIGK